MKKLIFIFCMMPLLAFGQATEFTTSDLTDPADISPNAIFNLLSNSLVRLPPTTTFGTNDMAITNMFVVFDGVGTTGLVTSAAADSNNFLRGDGTWQPVAGGGGSFTNLFMGPDTTGSVTSTSSDTNLFLAGNGMWLNPIATSTQFESDSSDGESTRDGTGWGGGTKLDFTWTNNLGSAATAQITWYSEIYSSDSGTRCEVRLRVTDGGIDTTRAETDWNPDSNQKIGWGPNGGSDFLSVTNGEAIRLRLQYRTSQSGKDVSIRRTRFFVILFKQ